MASFRIVEYVDLNVRYLRPEIFNVFCRSGHETS